MAKRASDAEEQAVIDDDLIAAALAEEQTSAASKHVGQVALADMVAEAHVLRLSFKNIKRIDNLHGFQALTKLCLDNNVIREISDLDHLVNLEWLDLSFNNIAKIEGLEKLTKLTDLSLFNNLIQDVDGLDTCANLQCLSIGNNNIAALVDSASAELADALETCDVVVCFSAFGAEAGAAAPLVAEKVGATDCRNLCGGIVAWFNAGFALVDPNTGTASEAVHPGSKTRAGLVRPRRNAFKFPKEGEEGGADAE